MKTGSIYVDRDINISADTTSIVVELMLAQYRMAKIEEIVTRNIFRITWLSFCVFITTYKPDIDLSQEYGYRLTSLLLEPFSYVMIAIVLFLISRRSTQRLAQQGRTIRSMLVSLDDKLKNYYVSEISRDQEIDGYTPSYGRIFSENEDLLWVIAAYVILYFHIAPIIFGLAR